MGSTELHAVAQGSSKEDVQEFWEASPCGEVYAAGASPLERLEAQARVRYSLEPYIREFAQFEQAAGLSVLEIGVGMGADHFEWARHDPRRLVGVDLTARAIGHTRTRFALAGTRARLLQADAETLPFPDGVFDIAYSWGVLHHTPDTPGAVREVHRVLKPGGVARVMIYHSRSIVGLLLWARYGLAAGRPMRRMDEIYAHYLESPGTKAYSIAEARQLFAPFERVRVTSRLSFADLLEGAAGDRHGGARLALLRRLWPRWLIRRVFPSWGLYLLIEAAKQGLPAGARRQSPSRPIT